MHGSTISQALEQLLKLETRPVGVAFVDQRPENVPEVTSKAPSACSYWRMAVDGPFFASGSAHSGCAVGAFTMGYAKDQEVQQRLSDTVQTMVDADYITSEEPSRLPIVAQPGAGAVYGPLAGFPVNPNVVLLWLNSRQAMLCSEASGDTDWSSPPGTIFGRPTCAAIPLAIQAAAGVFSYGCVGMRIYTDTDDNHLLGVLAGGDYLEEFVDRLTKTVESNEEMAIRYLMSLSR